MSAYGETKFDERLLIGRLIKARSNPLLPTRAWARRGGGQYKRRRRAAYLGALDLSTEFGRG
jgi:hypothetical protein